MNRAPVRFQHRIGAAAGIVIRQPIFNPFNKRADNPQGGTPIGMIVHFINRRFVQFIKSRAVSSCAFKSATAN